METDESKFADGFTFGKIDVKIYEGDITADDADCIINSSNEELDLSRGAVSKAILEKGGKALAAELKAKAAAMKRDKIAVTTGYGLNCKNVIHVVAAESDKWRPVVDKILMKAEELQAKSIAFPALGTSLGVSAEEIATVMFKAIFDFKPKTVTEVRIVIFQSQMVSEFVDTAQKQCLGAKPKGVWGMLKRTLIGGGEEQVPRKVPLKSLQPKKEVVQINKVWIDVYAFEKSGLDDAISRLNYLVNNDFTRADFADPVIKKFAPDQVSTLQRHGEQLEVQITVDIVNGKIGVEGVSDRIMKMSDMIHRLIRDVDKREQNKRSAEMLIKLIQWYYIEITSESSDLKPYTTDLNFLIETAFKDQKPSITIRQSDGQEYKIDFNKMEESALDDPTDTVTVIRKDLISEMGAYEQPPTWSTMSPKENLRVVPLQNTDQEYQEVQTKFLQSVGGNRTVLKVERIQNRTLFQQYEAKKKLIEQTNPGHQNENDLWHGTSSDAVDSITMHGFNRSYCGKNAVAFGNGVYFAKDASYSAQDAYSRPDPNGTRKMYLCMVLTGKYAAGSSGMRVPPPKSTSNPNDLYDSVVNSVGSPTIFVIFNDTQAYPKYMITFK